MGKSTAAGNVTAEEYTDPTVVRDALGRDHIVGPMSNMDEVEQKRRELDDAGKGEQERKIDDEKQAEPKQTETPAGDSSAAQAPASAPKAGTSTTTARTASGK